MEGIKGIIIGGLLPAMLFGAGSILQKAGNRIGIAQSHYLFSFATGIIAAGVVSFFVMKSGPISFKAGAFAAGHGFLFGAGFVLMGVGIVVFNMPISKIVPLVNMSALVAVALGLVVFKEYASVNAFNLLAGAVLIVAGGILVGKA
jgi:transporter family protein